MITPNALVIPDSLLAKGATAILREHSTDLLFNHSIKQDIMSMNEFRRLAAKIDQHMQQLAAQGVSEAHAIINRMLGV